MGSLPFTVYDFFAYLSSGTVIVALVDYLYGQHWLLKDKLPPAQWVLLVIVAYVTGHAVAHLSSIVFESGLVRRSLGQPSATLMGEKPKRIFLGHLFPGYYRALPAETIDRIRKQAAARDVFGTGEALFLHAFAIITKDERPQKRLDEFRNVYGFARNMAFSLLVAAAALGTHAALFHSALEAKWALPASALGITMLYRYLKFFRQYSYQLFITYAELPGDHAAMIKGAP